MSDIQFMMKENGTIVVLHPETFVPTPVVSSHANYGPLLEAIKNGNYDEAVHLLDTLHAVRKAVASVPEIEVTENEVLYKGEPLHNVVTEKILRFVSLGLPFEALVNFLAKLMRNPSYRAREQLFSFLQHGDFVIRPDGDFIAYKVVDSNFKSKRVGKEGVLYDWTPGNVVQMDRAQVDDDPNRTCSAGLHVCSYTYIQSFKDYGDKLLLVAVSPEDVVSVPADYNNAKMRTCRVTSIEEVPGDTANLLRGGDVYEDGDEDDYEPEYGSEEYYEWLDRNDNF